MGRRHARKIFSAIASPTQQTTLISISWYAKKLLRIIRGHSQDLMRIAQRRHSIKEAGVKPKAWLMAVCVVNVQCVMEIVLFVDTMSVRFAIGADTTTFIQHGQCSSSIPYIYIYSQLQLVYLNSIEN